MNNVKLLHIKCCFYQFFNSPVSIEAPQKKLKWRPWVEHSFIYLFIHLSIVDILTITLDTTMADGSTSIDNLPHITEMQSAKYLVGCQWLIDNIVGHQ